MSFVVFFIRYQPEHNNTVIFLKNVDLTKKVNIGLMGQVGIHRQMNPSYFE